MNRRPYTMLVGIIVLLVLSLWIDLSKTISITNPLNSVPIFTRDVDIKLGLDLRGGLETLLQVPDNVAVTGDQLNVAKTILENRANALGVSEVLMQVAPPRRIIAEFPGISNPEQVIASLKQTGLLEFVDFGTNPLATGSVIKTDYLQSQASGAASTPGVATTATAATATSTATLAPSPTPNGAATPTASETPTSNQVYHTVMTGTALQTVSVVRDPTTGAYQISFTLKPSAATTFSDYTGSHINQYLAIVLDKKVISAPQIQGQISGGSGVIQGSFTNDTANALAVQLRYGSLPVPINVAESRTVGPTLGEESIHKSIIAGIIGLSVVVLFMGLYYRLPGAVADGALLIYALLSLALFKIIPVTLTLPGIAGFILSIGMAVDANILIFERLKEELRSGRTLRQAIDLGWQRAWPSIRDSNSSTLITCLILYIFGSTYGASMVKGFAVTLALGVAVSLFTAVIVTRTLLHVVLDNTQSAEHPSWFGL